MKVELEVTLSAEARGFIEAMVERVCRAMTLGKTELAARELNEAELVLPKHVAEALAEKLSGLAMTDVGSARDGRQNGPIWTPERDDLLVALAQEGLIARDMIPRLNALPGREFTKIGQISDRLWQLRQAGREIPSWVHLSVGGGPKKKAAEAERAAAERAPAEEGVDARAKPEHDDGEVTALVTLDDALAAVAAPAVAKPEKGVDSLAKKSWMPDQVRHDDTGVAPPLLELAPAVLAPAPVPVKEVIPESKAPAAPLSSKPAPAEVWSVARLYEMTRLRAKGVEWDAVLKAVNALPGPPVASVPYAQVKYSKMKQAGTLPTIVPEKGAAAEKATEAQIRVWAVKNRLPNRTELDLGAVNAKRAELGLPVFELVGGAKFVRRADA